MRRLIPFDFFIPTIIEVRNSNRIENPNSKSLKLSLYIIRRFYPFLWLIVEVWALIRSSFLLIFIWRYSKGHSHFYHCHHQPFHFFILSTFRHLHFWFSWHFWLFRILFINNKICIFCCRVVFESLSTCVKGFLFSQG